MYKVSVERGFSAAHQLVGYDGPCENLHGHNWNVKAEVRARQLDVLGMGMDFKKLKRILEETVQHLDHQFLNRIAPFEQSNPTAENLARFIFEKLKERLPEGVEMNSVSVSESQGCTVVYSED